MTLFTAGPAQLYPALSAMQRAARFWTPNPNELDIASTGYVGRPENGANLEIVDDAAISTVDCIDSYGVARGIHLATCPKCVIGSM